MLDEFFGTTGHHYLTNFTHFTCVGKLFPTTKIRIKVQASVHDEGTRELLRATCRDAHTVGS